MFTHITDGKWHDSNMLDMIAYEPNDIYLMEQAGTFFVTRPKSAFAYILNSCTLEIDRDAGI
ncbi:MAG: hypothetical protein SNG38_03025 [Rikenellaceae bacterium]